MGTKSPNLLAQKAVLAAVTISMWTARRFDRVITDETNKRHNAEANAGRYNKLLIDKNDLSPLTTIHSAARMRHYMLTQPWLDDGSRLLSSALYMSYADEMRKFKAEFDMAAEKFAHDYPNMIERAKKRLNGMFNVADYPSADAIRQHFNFDIKIMPCPDASDFRVDIAKEHLSAMQSDVEDRMKQALAATTNDIKARIVEVVGHMSERLKAYKPSDGDNRAEGTFRDSLVENVRELVGLLPAFNLTDDPKLTAICKRMEKELCVEDADTLRTEAKVRQSVTKAADKILTDVAAFMA